MSYEDSLEVRQNNEFEALQAIYGDDLKDLRKKAAWNKWTPLDLSITLTPQRGSSGNREVYVKVNLHIICSETYPNKVPSILLENGKGISQTFLLQLKDELEEKAQDYKGEEMIFQLCQHVEEFLHRHNKPAMKSFYHEMLQQQQEKKKEEEMQKQLEVDRKRENMMKEVQKRQEMLKAEVRLQRERQRSITEIECEEETHRKSSLSNRRNNNSSTTETSEESSCDHKGTVMLEFNGRNVQRGKCLSHNDPYNVTFTGIDTETGELVEISQWNLPVKSHESSQILKNVASIEQELNYLLKFCHINLVHYLGFKYDFVGDRVVVYVLKEFVSGTTCNSLFSIQNLKVDIDYLKHLAKGTLTAIDYIHRNKAVHKDLSDKCVSVNEKGIIKVSDYSIPRRLLDLVTHSTHTHCNYSKMTDIFDFGKLILCLLGYEDNIEVPTNIQSDLYDLLLKCLCENEEQRLTANQLLNHSFFHKPIVHFSPQQIRPDIPIERNISPEITHPSFLSTSIGIGQAARIENEFEILDNLGKGAFGDVLKVKNKLDGGYYAIKRIKLNPKNKALNKKIVREVTLLSRLNHENVVRYYNSWIEPATVEGNVDADSSGATTTTPTSEHPRKPMEVVRKDELSFDDDIEAMAPPMKKVEISIAYDNASSDDDDDDDSSDGDDSFKVPNRFNQDSDSDSDGIEFARGSDDDDEESSSSKNCTLSTDNQCNELKSESPQNIPKQKEFLYIQMEFCEKSTLRTAIDENLYLDEDRVWRLFREIVEGLTHIHQQGMIHRDLKPVNIFLDSFDHVKIGDFGLATTIAIRSKQGDVFGVSKSQAESLREDLGDESKTGQVGTALYVAPEINSAAKGFYNQKVDIYSLGIILFEMCYKPLETGMERIKILTKLRMKDITFPEEFCQKNERAQFLIRWLLNHDISKRPTSQELLQSEHLPPPVLEERELQELVRHTLSNPQLKGYRYLISSCFKQKITPAQDITYDRDPIVPISSKPLNVLEFVREACVKIFKQHGAQNLATPLLMPKSKYYEDAESCVKLMTHFGNIVSLPHDLRVSFARYVAWNNISSFRRYSVERVYKEKKVFGFMPREFYECAFDIVTPNQGSLMADAETLYLVYEIIKELPGVKNKHFLIRLNHTALFRAILLHCGLKDKHEELLHLLQDIKDGKVPKSQLQNFLIHKGLSDNMINLLINFINSEIEISKATNQFQTVTKKKSGEASALAKLALQELKTIVQNAEIYGVTFDFVIAPGLVYNIQQFSGMICQVACELKKKRKHDNKEVVAFGGRYDTMISYYRNIMEQTSMLPKGIQQSAVGISISLDKLVQAVQKEESEDMPRLDALDAIVCSVGSKQLIKEKTKILRSLWAAGVRCSLIEASNTVEVQEQLMELGVSYAIILKDNDQGLVRIRSWDKDSRESFDRFQEKLYTTSELVENMQKILKNRSDSIGENTQSSSLLTRSESKTSYSERNESEAVVDILLVTTEKLSSNSRRRCENQVRSQLDGLFKKLSGPTTVIAVNIESSVIRTLTSFLEFENEAVFWKSVNNCTGKHQKHKQYLNEICEEIMEVRMKKTNPTVILYSLTDNFYKVFI
ncbi:unnamed protein product [Ceutorhynchus assimilis]|uniref:non-specific serine/threonine protein kinase n=1 Tax=Ceutorhynchus assimilis TaxID=467358 RepID=A0A9N9QGK1_9CUCU|nr:unnamed protein product [Ceutorhynchus assimilis]